MRADASTTRPPENVKLDPVDLAARVDAGKLGELDRPLGRVLDRRVEDLAARHVGAARVDLPLAAVEPEAEVGARGDDAHLLRRVEELLDPPHALALGLPVDQHRAVEEVGELLELMPASCASAGVG